MSIQITYFVHGTTVDNEQGVSSGWFDAELSELGKQQSIKLREQTKDKKFDVVFCSDLKRAADSAQLAFMGTVPIISDARLRECSYGIFNGQPSEIVEPMQEQMITEKFPEGESYEDVKTRMADFLEFLKKNYQDKHIAIVAHKAPQLALDVLLKNKDKSFLTPRLAYPLQTKDRLAYVVNKTWEQAFAEDWRKTKAWQPGWEYELI